MILRKLVNKPLYILSNHTLYIDCNLKTIHGEAKCSYRKFHYYPSTHSNPLIKNLSSITIPRAPQVDLNVNGVEIYEIERKNHKIKMH